MSPRSHLVADGENEALITGDTNNADASGCENEDVNDGYEWKDDSTGLRVKPFLKTSGLLINMEATASPYDYFRLLFDDELLNFIFLTDEMNRYAESLFLSASTMYHSRITRWVDVTSEDILRFIGLIFHTGTIKCNKI